MPKFDKDRFKNVLHYIISKCHSSPNFGKTVLYKLLYFSDFDFFELYEKPLTGEIYHKIKHGPAPKHFDNAIAKLKEEKAIQVVQTEYYGHPQKKYIALKYPDVSQFSAQEIEVVDRVIQFLGSMNATQISEWSHLDTPWIVTKDDDPIDYELVFYRDNITSVRVYQDDCVRS